MRAINLNKTHSPEDQGAWLFHEGRAVRVVNFAAVKDENVKAQLAEGDEIEFISADVHRTELGCVAFALSLIEKDVAEKASAYAQARSAFEEAQKNNKAVSDELRRLLRVENE